MVDPGARLPDKTVPHHRVSDLERCAGWAFLGIFLGSGSLLGYNRVDRGASFRNRFFSQWLQVYDQNLIEQLLQNIFQAALAQLEGAVNDLDE